MAGNYGDQKIHSQETGGSHHYLFCDYDDFVCVDGLQRITAITSFLNNEIPIFGCHYEQFEDKINRCSASSNLRININDLQTKKEVLEWYYEMNAGGTPHTDDELNKVKNMIGE